jgi:hypothetical protein
MDKSESSGDRVMSSTNTIGIVSNANGRELHLLIALQTQDFLRIDGDTLYARNSRWTLPFSPLGVANISDTL